MLKGKQSILFDEPPYLISSGSVVGKKEGEGPLGQLFDLVEEENLFGKDSWEEAESEMQKEACLMALGKRNSIHMRFAIFSVGTSFVKVLRHQWDWKNYTFRFLDYMVHVLPPVKRLH